MDTLSWILFLGAVLALFLSYLRAQAVESKVQRVLREFQRLSQNLDEMKKAVRESVETLRKDIHDKMPH